VRSGIASSVRVVQVTPAIARESSGPSYSVIRLNGALRDHGIDSCVAALDWPGTRVGLPNVRLFKMGVGPRRLGRSPAMMRWLHELAAHCPSLILHGHAMWQATGWYPSRAAKGTNARVVISPRGTFGNAAFGGGSALKRAVWPLIQRPACRAADCFHATADSEAQEIRALGFVQPIAVVPNGIDVTPDQYPVLPRSKTVVFLGRIHPKKNIPTLIRAWHAIEPEFSEWSLCFAGSDESYYGVSGHLDEMKSLCRDLALQRVRFVGDVHGVAKATLLSCASLFVLPTKNENFGIAVAEALAHGVPAIVTKGAPWAGLDDHKAGWWIDFGVDSLVHALRRALSSTPAQLAAMGARGREWMIRDFSWDVVGAKMAETYRWLDGQRPKPDWVV
jgi:glycosyltransferase involved in cell wall biosynthesis